MQYFFASISCNDKKTLVFKRVILVEKMKEVITIRNSSCTRIGKPWGRVRFDLKLARRNKCFHACLNPGDYVGGAVISGETKDISLRTITDEITNGIPVSLKIVVRSAMIGCV